MKPVGRKTIPLAFSLGLILFLLLSGCSGNGSGGNGDDNSSSSPVSNSIATVFLAKENNTTATQLYGSTLDGASIVRLSGNLVSGGNVEDFAISPDGRFVAYLADQQVFNNVELYVVPVDGGTPTNVSRQSTIILQVEDFAWSFDSSTIAFRAFNPVPNTVGNVELFTVPVSGGTPVRVSIFPNPDGEVSTFAWAPSKLLLAYTQNTIEGSPDRIDLYSTRPSNQDNNKLSNTTGTGSTISTVKSFKWSPNSLLIAFNVVVRGSGLSELLVADPSVVFPTPVPLSGTLQSLGEVVGFEWSPDSRRVAYRADQFVDNRFDLLTVLSDGSRPPDPVSRLTNDSSEVSDFAWAPDNTRIAYIADQDTVGVFELYTNNTVGTSLRKVSDDLSGSEDVWAFAWAPDSSLIAYQANQEESNKDELYTTVPDIAQDFVKISGSPTSGGLLREVDFAAFGWAPDNSRVAYIARQSTDFYELYSSTPDGATNNSVVSGPLVSGGNVDSLKWSPDSSRVAYRADQDTINVPELYSSQPDGSDNVKISSGKVEDIYDWVP